MSVCSPYAAELFYLRHIRSCAAATRGNNGGHPGQNNTLQISGADLIASSLQSIWRACDITLFTPLAKLLQSIYQIGQYYINNAMKLITLFLAMLQSTLEIAQEVPLTWLTPLEFAACLHLANFPIHQDLHIYQCETNH